MSASSKWVRELTRQQRLPVPWARMLRVAVAVAVPVSIGAVIGQLGLGLLCSIGALGGSLADAEGTVRFRIVRVAGATTGGFIGFVVGGLVFGHPAWTAASVVIGGLVAGVVSVQGAVASVAALQFLLYLIVASGADFGPVPPWLPSVGYVAGSAWALMLALIESAGSSRDPGRDTVADVYAKLSDYMAACGGPGTAGGPAASSAVDARSRLTVAMNKAYDTVQTSRAHVGGSDRHIRRQAAFLNAATPVIEATTARAVHDQPVPSSVVAWVAALADRIRRTEPPRTDDDLPVPLLAGADWRDLAEGLEAVDELARHTAHSAVPAVTGPSPVTRAMRLPGAVVPRVTVRSRIGAVWDTVAGGPETWMPILRLVLCLATGELVVGLSSAERPYWIVMTIAVTLKPDYGSVFARAVQRGVGTVVGVLIGSALLALSPGAVVPLVGIAVFAALVPFAQRRNYGLFTTFLTPVIVLLLDLGAGGGFELVISRVADTAIGCAIVLIVGYLPWPDTWRSRLRFGPRIARAASALAAYIRIGLGAAPGTRQAVRREAYRQLSDLRTALQQALSEPPPVSSTAAGWWPVIVTLERAVDATTAIIVQQGADEGEGAAAGDPPAIDPVAVEQLARAAEAIGEAARDRGVAAAPPLPRDVRLEPLTAELRAGQAVLRHLTRPPE
ncbi:FUSC family protein [Microbacterium terrisoli]|uniref:FUSC family protein n=1 Tax=Microbacterium terrisoli TaxID=3242192 RepID=UPI002804C54D|nr:FUSC family protein [Microbacterium protaetiae]